MRGLGLGLGFGFEFAFGFELMLGLGSGLGLVGELLPLQVSADGGCGKWMPIEYRMCAANLPEPPERERDLISFNIYLKEGEFYAA